MTSLKMCSFTMLTLTARYEQQLYRCNDASTDRINQGKLLPSPKAYRFPFSIYSKSEGKIKDISIWKVFCTFTTSKQIYKKS